MKHTTKQSNGSFSAGVTGLILGASLTAIYIHAKDKTKREQVKETFDQVKKIAAEQLDQVQERLNQEQEEAREDIKDINNGHGLTVH